MLLWQIENNIDFKNYEYVKFSKELQQKINSLNETYDENFDPRTFNRFLQEEADYFESTPDLSSSAEDEEDSCWPGDESQRTINDIVGSFDRIVGLDRHSDRCELSFYLLITEQNQDRGYKSPRFGYIHYLFFSGTEEDAMHSILVAEAQTKEYYKELKK